MRPVCHRYRPYSSAYPDRFLEEIADTLHITFRTVNGHIKKIYEKLHVRSRTEAVAKRINGNYFPSLIEGKIMKAK